MEQATANNSPKMEQATANNSPKRGVLKRTPFCNPGDWHGWSSSCIPPCKYVPTASPGRWPSTAAQARDLLRKSAALDASAASTLRIRSPLADGFWVRALFVIAQAIWATLNTHRFYVQLHAGAGASCRVLRARCANASACMTRTRCDAYFDPTSMPGADGWSEFFEPIGADARRVSTTLELECNAAWSLYTAGAKKDGALGIYPKSIAAARRYRQRNAEYVAQWVRVTPAVRAIADAEWRRRVPATARAVIGVHLRGTDKYVRKSFSPARYFAKVDAFLATHGEINAHIFLATDDAGYRDEFLHRYGRARVAMQAGGELLRATSRHAQQALGLKGGGSTHAVWKDTSGEGGYRRGLEVLLDTLLLSRCDYLLKSASAVSEFAIYFNPALINRSHDFSGPGGGGGGFT